MPSPFPGMDPYLEHPALWPDVHNSLLAAIRDALTPLVAPRYYVALERRTYLLKADDLVFIGRPDVAVVRGQERQSSILRRITPSSAVLDVEVPLGEEVSENFLEVHEVRTATLVTILELRSPANKLSGAGRQAYEDKRTQVLRTRTNFVEVDLLRAGEPMPVVGPALPAGYRILVSRGVERPRARLYAWGLRDPIPVFPLPLLPRDAEPPVELGTGPSSRHSTIARASTSVSTTPSPRSHRSGRKTRRGRGAWSKRTRHRPPEGAGRRRSAASPGAPTGPPAAVAAARDPRREAR